MGESWVIENYGLLGKGCLKQKPIYLPEEDIQSIYMRDFKISQTVMNYEILINAFLQCLIRNLTWMLTFLFFLTIMEFVC